MGRAGGFGRSIWLVRTRGSRFGRCTGHARVFLLCFLRGLARGGVSGFWACPRRKNEALSSEKKTKRNSCEKRLAYFASTAFLLRPSRARWTKTTPAREETRHQSEKPPATTKPAHAHSSSSSSSLSSSLSSASSSHASPSSAMKASYAAWLSGWTGLLLFVAFC